MRTSVAFPIAFATAISLFISPALADELGYSHVILGAALGIANAETDQTAEPIVIEQGIYLSYFANLLRTKSGRPTGPQLTPFFAGHSGENLRYSGFGISTGYFYGGSIGERTKLYGFHFGIGSANISESDSDSFSFNGIHIPQQTSTFFQVGWTIAEFTRSTGFGYFIRFAATTLPIKAESMSGENIDEAVNLYTMDFGFLFALGI